MKKFTETKAFTFDKAIETVVVVPSGSVATVSVWDGSEFVECCVITGADSKSIKSQNLTLQVALTSGVSYSVSDYASVVDE